MSPTRANVENLLRATRNGKPADARGNLVDRTRQASMWKNLQSAIALKCQRVPVFARAGE